MILSWSWRATLWPPTFKVHRTRTLGDVKVVETLDDPVAWTFASLPLTVGWLAWLVATVAAAPGYVLATACALVAACVYHAAACCTRPCRAPKTPAVVVTIV